MQRYLAEIFLNSTRGRERERERFPWEISFQKASYKSAHSLFIRHVACATFRPLLIVFLFAGKTIR